MLEDELEQTTEQEVVEDRGDVVDPELLPEDERADIVEPEAEEAPAEQEPDLDSLREIAGDEDRPKMVPHARFNEVNESLKAEREARLRLEEELARARGAEQPAAEQEAEEEAGFDFEAADQSYTDALYEGDTEKARQIRAEIRAAERAEYERLAEERAEARIMERMARQEQERTQATLEQTAAELTEKYSFLDSQSADADKVAITEVVALRDAYIASGTSPADALRQAADRVAKMHGVETDTEPKAEGSARLTQEQIDRNLGREQQIPPRDRGVGERAARIDYGNLTDAEFEKLTETEKAKARGDFIS